MKKILIKIGIYAIIAVSLIVCITTISNLKKENKRLESNQEILLSEKEVIMAKSQAYKVSDSLNAAKVTELQLTLAEYKRFREDDLKLIEQLKINKKELQSVISSQAETILDLYARARDTIIINEEVPDTIKYFNYKSKWTDVNGYVSLNTNNVNLKIANRESLKIIETAEYKRFLGFLWRTKKIKSRHVDVISENPATSIINVDYTSIRK